MTSTHPALDELHTTLVEVKEALVAITEAIDEGLQVLETWDGEK